MKFALFDHAGKGGYLRQKLLERGHELADSVEGTELLLLDCDWAWAHPRPFLIQHAVEVGAKVALYPHGGVPQTFVYDGLTEPDARVDLRLEHGPQTVAIGADIHPALNQFATGWLFSPTRPYKPRKKRARTVLFAPQHPNMATVGSIGNGHDPAPSLNAPVYRRLLELDLDVVVTYCGPWWGNGIWAWPRVKMEANHEMRFERTFELVQQADVVVGAGTVAALGIASGKPTVMLGQGNFADWVDGAYRLPDNTDLYAEILRYPIDVEDGDLEDMIGEACSGGELAEQAENWRHLFVGDDGTDNAVSMLEELVAGVGPNTSSTHAIIQGVTAKATGLSGA